MTMQNDFSTIKKEIDDLAKQQLNLLYPSFEFRTKPAYFVSSLHLDGTPAKGGKIDKTFIYKSGYAIAENGGGSLSLFDFFCQQRNLHGNAWENLREYARAVGYELPENETLKKQMQEQENKRQAIEQAVNIYVSARQMNQGRASGLEIDKFIAGRGWSYQYADAWRIGYDVNHQTHPLTFPVTRNGKIEQIARRTLYGTTTAQKYLNEPGKKLDYLGFAPAYSEILFIAEGIPDAMALNYHGFPGGCSFSNNLNQGQKENIIKRIKGGLKCVYLIADKDSAGDEATPKNGAFIIENGCECHVITFSDCKDADEYFFRMKHTPQEFAQLIANAPTFAVYMYNRHRTEHKRTNDLNAYIKDVATLYADTPAPADKMAIYNAMKTNADSDGYLFAVFEDEIKRALENKTKENPQKEQSTQGKAQNLFKPYQAGDVWKRAGIFSPEIKTGYDLNTMDAQDDAQPWTIPADDLTLICGYTSHGKTKVLQNLCLNMALDTQTKGRFIFVSYEESDGAILREMANIRINKNITPNPKEKTNLEIIGDFLQTGGQTNCNGYQQEIIKHIDELDDLASRGRLLVEETSAPVDVLCEAIRQQVEQFKGDENPVKAVFVDYVQLLEMDGAEKMTPNIVLKNIALRLHETAKQTQTAIICGAQLKREDKDKNPIYINESDVADSAYLERTSAQVVIIYDGHKLEFREFAKMTGNNLNDGQKQLFYKGFANVKRKANGDEVGKLEAPGRLYLKVCKHRGRRANVDGVLQYTPTTGNICNLPAEVWGAGNVWEANAQALGIEPPRTKDKDDNILNLFDVKGNKQTPAFIVPNPF